MRRRWLKLLYAYYLFHFKGFLKILWLLPISFPSDNVKVGSLFYPTDSRRPLWSEKAWNTNNHTVVPISRIPSNESLYEYIHCSFHSHYQEKPKEHLKCSTAIFFSTFAALPDICKSWITQIWDRSGGKSHPRANTAK